MLKSYALEKGCEKLETKKKSFISNKKFFLFFLKSATNLSQWSSIQVVETDWEPRLKMCVCLNGNYKRTYTQGIESNYSMQILLLVVVVFL